MFETDLLAFRQELEWRREEINALLEMSVESRGAVELDQTSVGRVSRIDAIQAQQIALAAERRRQEELVRIENALRRVDDGSFGECLVCGEQIATKRLEFDPSITTCIACASASAR